MCVQFLSDLKLTCLIRQFDIPSLINVDILKIVEYWEFTCRNIEYLPVKIDNLPVVINNLPGGSLW